jgi:hypothetical protein
MSCYNLDEADIADQRQRFELFDREARRLLEVGPAALGGRAAG